MKSLLYILISSICCFGWIYDCTAQQQDTLYLYSAADSLAVRDPNGFLLNPVWHNAGSTAPDIEEICRRVIIIEKGGLPVVAIMDIDEFEDYLEVKDPSVKRHIAASAREHAAGKGRPAKEFFAELEAEKSASHGGAKRRRGT